MLKQAVEDDPLLKDKVEVQVYPNSLLYDDDKKLMDALSKDEIQLAAPSISKLVEYNPKLKVFDLPYLFDNVEAVSRFQEEMTGNLFKTDLSQNKLLSAPNQDQGNNFLVLAYWHGGMKQLSANKKLEKLADVSGLKIRIQSPIDLENPSKNVLETTFKAWGAKPQPKSFGDDVYKNLKNGNLDGQENIWSNNLAEKYYEVQNYFYETNHGYLGYLLITGTQFWQKLPNDVQTQLTTVIQNVTVQVNELAEEMNKEARQKIIDETEKANDSLKEVLTFGSNSNLTAQLCATAQNQFDKEVMDKEVMDMARNYQMKCPNKP